MEFDISYLNGSLSLLHIFICILICLLLVNIYRESKSREYLFVGLTVLIFSSPWWPSAISIILYIFTNEGLPDVIYFFIGNFFTPFGLISWLIAFTDMMYEDYKYPILIIYSILAIIFEIFLIFFLITDPSEIGTISGIVDVSYRSFVMIYLLIVAITLIISGILFAKETMRSTNPKIKWSGRFILIGFISFNISAVLDGFFSTNTITLILVRILLISSMLEIYFSFNMPKFLERILI
ncbi:MAG: conserved membrane protein of unknown function [Promethearchaeota archaeon]|nr:MAG: conserved membrane protein of unknown function [Candidatus Lokiarchaeota archaeon]